MNYNERLKNDVEIVCIIDFIIDILIVFYMPNNNIFLKN